jgi:phage-related protein
MPGNPLHAEVTADSADYVSSVEAAVQSAERLGDQATETAAAMHLLQGRTEKAGNEALTAGAKAGASSSGFSSLAASAASTQVSFNTLSVATTATLIPALAALSTVLAPLLAAMGGFVTVAGSIVGVGLVGFLGAVATNGDRLKSTFQELTSTIRNQFAPVFDVFAGVLDRLMQRLMAIIPQLVPAQKVVKQVAGQFEQLGQAIIGVLPAFTELAVQLAQRFLPPFVEWTQQILPKIPGLLQRLIPIMQQVGATLQPLAAAFLDMAPVMTEFGMRVLNIIVPALTTSARWFNRAMEAVNGLRKQVAGVVTSLTLAAPVIAKAGLALAGLSNPATAAALAVGALGTAFATNFGGIRTTIMNAVRAMQQFVASLRLGQIVQAVGVVRNLRGAFRQLQGVVNMFVSGIQPAINRFVTTLKQNRPAIRGFFREISQSVNGVVDIFRTVFLPAIQTVLQNVTIPLINRFSKVFAQHFGTVLRTATTTIDGIQSVFRSFGTVVSSTITTVQATLRPLITWLRSTFGSEIRIVFNEIGRTLTVWTNTVSQVITRVRGALQPFVTWIRGKFRGAIQTALNLVRAAWNRFGDEIVAVVRFAFSTVRGVIETTMDVIRTGTVATLRLLRGDFSGAFDAIANLVRNTLSGLRSYVSTWGGKLKSAVSSAVDNAKTAITNGFDEAVGAGKDALNGLLDWLRNKWDIATSLGSAFDGAGDAAANAFKDAFNAAIPDSIGIPSKTIETPAGDATIGGGSISLPQLDTGGYIEEDGIAQLHAGERVVPAAQVSDRGSAPVTVEKTVDRGTDRGGEIVEKLDELTRAVGALEQGDVRQKDVLRALDVAEDRYSGRGS